MLNPNPNPDRGPRPPPIRRRRQRGLSLVELAIVLAAVGLVLGGALVPLYQQRLGDDLDHTRRRLDDIHAAIEGYAIRHRTPGLRYIVNVQQYNSGSPVSAGPRSSAPHSFRVPANRPYLPCPDYSGDGIENRLAMHNPLLSQILNRFLADAQPVVDPDAASFSDVVERDVWPAFDLYQASPFAQYSLARHGTCGFYAVGDNIDRGALPWRTLGVPPADKWGTRFTYRVDQLYASALTGFGEDLRADGYDPRVPVHSSGRIEGAGNLRRIMRLRTFWDVGARGRSEAALYTHLSMTPTLVCGDLGGLAGTPLSSSPICNPLSATSSDITTLGSDFDTLLAGDVATEVVPWTAANLRPVPFPRSIPSGVGALGRNVSGAEVGGVTEGVPYVVLSHGPNRSFGFDHRTLRLELPALPDPHPCLWQRDNSSWYDTARPFLMNLRGRTAERTISRGEAHNSPCPVRPRNVFDYNLPPNLFYSQPRASSSASFQGNDAFDDIVEWRTRAQINSLMAAAGVFPAHPLPLLATF